MSQRRYEFRTRIAVTSSSSYRSSEAAKMRPEVGGLSSLPLRLHAGVLPLLLLRPSSSFSRCLPSCLVGAAYLPRPERLTRATRSDGLEGVEMDGEAEACTYFEIYATRALRQGEKIVVGWEWEASDEASDAVHRVGEVRGVYLFIFIFSSRFSHYIPYVFLSS
ncbi:hypothetical protein B0H14DRAFT_2798419 [Mycena olivaceomarginata]|nr:hypothetical protein B0H14DRAFT_2798419 [Mycena olivaceomarginata]